MKGNLNEFDNLDAVHQQNQYISNQEIIFSPNQRAEVLKDLAITIESNLDETIDWLSSITESKWKSLYDSLEIIEGEYKQNIATIQMFVQEKGLMFVNANKTLEAIAHLQQCLNHIGFMLLGAEAMGNHMKSIVAKNNRRKQKRIDPNKQRAIDEAVTMWKRTPKLSLDDIAEHIRNQGISDKSHAQIKKWISPYNPKQKNKVK